AANNIPQLSASTKPLEKISLSKNKKTSTLNKLPSSENHLSGIVQPISQNSIAPTPTSTNKNTSILINTPSNPSGTLEPPALLNDTEFDLETENESDSDSDSEYNSDTGFEKQDVLESDDNPTSESDISSDSESDTDSSDMEPETLDLKKTENLPRIEISQKQQLFTGNSNITDAQNNKILDNLTSKPPSASILPGTQPLNIAIQSNPKISLNTTQKNISVKNSGKTSNKATSKKEPNQDNFKEQNSPINKTVLNNLNTVQTNNPNPNNTSTLASGIGSGAAKSSISDSLVNNPHSIDSEESEESDSETESESESDGTRSSITTNIIESSTVTSTYGDLSALLKIPGSNVTTITKDANKQENKQVDDPLESLLKTVSIDVMSKTSDQPSIDLNDKTKQNSSGLAEDPILVSTPTKSKNLETSLPGGNQNEEVPDASPLKSNPLTPIKAGMEQDHSNQISLFSIKKAIKKHKILDQQSPRLSKNPVKKISATNQKTSITPISEMAASLQFSNIYLNSGDLSQLNYKLTEPDALKTPFGIPVLTHSPKNNNLKTNIAQVNHKSAEIGKTLSIGAQTTASDSSNNSGSDSSESEVNLPNPKSSEIHKQTLGNNMNLFSKLNEISPSNLKKKQLGSMTNKIDANSINTVANISSTKPSIAAIPKTHQIGETKSSIAKSKNASNRQFAVVLPKATKKRSKKKTLLDL
ncbi:hypothetical protein BB560_003645, partial [Smittium megazygosporum]